MRALSWLGLAFVVVVTGVAVWQLSSILGASVLAGIAGWGWMTRDRVPGVQAKASLVCALGMGFLYVSSVFTEVSRTLVETDLGAAKLLAAGSIVLLVPGLGACVYACRALARGKGRTGWLGLLGLLNIVGYAVVLFVPPARNAAAPAQMTG